MWNEQVLEIHGKRVLREKAPEDDSKHPNNLTQLPGFVMCARRSFFRMKNSEATFVLLLLRHIEANILLLKSSSNL